MKVQLEYIYVKSHYLTVFSNPASVLYVGVNMLFCSGAGRSEQEGLRHR